MPLLYKQHTRLAHTEGHADAIAAVSFSPDGQHLASGGLDGRVCIWDVASGKLLYTFSGKSPVLSVAWVDSGKDLVCGMTDGTIASLLIRSRQIQLEGFLAHKYPVERLSFNGTYLASGAHKEVKVWGRGTHRPWKLIADLAAPRRSSHTTKCDIITTSLHWTSGASHPVVLLVTYLSHGVAAFDARTWARIGGTALPGCIADATLTKDGRILAISNMLTGFELFEDIGRGPPIPLRFLHGDHALLGGTLHGQVNIWDIHSRRKQSLTLVGNVSVLAIGAHYDSTNDDFFIATGIFNIGSPSAIVIWKTKEARSRRGASTLTRLGGNSTTPPTRYKMWGLFACGALAAIMLGAGRYIADAYRDTLAASDGNA